MRKRFLAVCFLSAIAALAMAVGCGADDKQNYGTLSVADIEIICGQTATIEPVFSDPNKAETVNYTFDGNGISITDGVVTGLTENTETTVTAKTAHHRTTFKVKVTVDYGTLTVADTEITVGQERLLIPVFSDESRAEDIEYIFEGNNISITDGLLKGLVPDTETVVTARTAHHTATFKVKVLYMRALLTDPNGEESKFAVSVPDADNYVVTGTVNVNMFRENGWTRTSAFAFNGSDNSWYNIELYASGDLILYGRFNGVEKYNIKLMNIREDGVLENGAFSYDIALLKIGQQTKFYVNEDLVCAFFDDEMTGYAKLGALEVTAAANRDDSGKYETDITKLMYHTEGSDTYAKYAGSADANELTFDDFTLEAEDGSERKFSLGIPYIKLGGDYLFGTVVTVNEYDTEKTRLSAFAFNGSDNSWYNIETDNAGNAVLYGRFNGVEKYNIRLFNVNDEGIKTDGKIRYSANILKKGQSTYFFINGILVCNFTDAELNGYGKLSSLEITAATDVWRDGGAYSVSFTQTKIQNSDSDDFALFDAATKEKSFDDAQLTAPDGRESKFAYGYVCTDFIFTARVYVEQYRENGWMRTSAFAFNGSDNSWYNIEMSEDGQLTLFARFNNVEKYHIPLFNVNDEGVINGNGGFSYDVAILKKGQSTYFFVNDKAVCSFSERELGGYASMTYLEVSAAADRANAGQYKVTVTNQKFESSDSENFKKYDRLTEPTPEN